MNYRKNIVIIFIISTIISLAGFYVDSDIKETSISVNALEIFMMTIIIAVLISIIYFPLSFFIQKIK